MESHGRYLATNKWRMLVTFPMNADPRLQHDEKSEAYGWNMQPLENTTALICSRKKNIHVHLDYIFSCWIKTMHTHHSCPAFPASIHRVTPSTMLLLLSFITLLLGHSNSDLKVSVKILQVDVKSIEYIVNSSIVTNPTDWDIRVFAKNNVIDPSIIHVFIVSKDGKDLPLSGIQVSLSSPLVSSTVTDPIGVL